MRGFIKAITRSSLLLLCAFGPFFSGGIGISQSSNPDPTIPAPNTVLRLTNNTSVGQGAFAAKIIPLCDYDEGGNNNACGNNQIFGDSDPTANASGTTSLTITAIGLSQNIYNGAIVTDHTTPGNVPAGTYIVSGVTGTNPLTPSSACLPSCTVTLNQAVGTFTGDTLWVNPPLYQQSTIASSLGCSSWQDYAPFSAPTIDPDTGDAYYAGPGGHDTTCNIMGVMKFSALAARQMQGPNFAASISGTTMTVNFTTITGYDGLQNGQIISDPGNGNVTPGTSIVMQLTGTPGGSGTYQVSISQTVGNEAMKATNTTTVSGWNQIKYPPSQIPLSYPTPAWQNQPTDSAATEFYLGPNFNGEFGWQSTHTYNAVNVSPANGFLTAGGIFTGGLGTRIAAGYYVDPNYNSTVIGPTIIAPNTVSGITFQGLNIGYALVNNGGSAGIFSRFGSDGNLYSETSDNFGNFTGVYLVNPFPVYQNALPLTSSSWAIGQAASVTGCFASFAPSVVISDPFVGGAQALVSWSTQSGSISCTGSGGVTTLQISSNIGSNSSAGTVKQVTLSGSNPLITSNCTLGNCTWSMTYDSIHNLIYAWDGSNTIAVITPNNTLTWTISGITFTAGTPPPNPTTGVCASAQSGSALQFFDINGAGFLEGFYCGDGYRFGLYDAGCPSPTADGTIMIPGQGRSCALQDSSGHVWTWSSSPTPPAVFTSRPIYSALEDGVQSQWNISGGFPTARVGTGIKMELKGGTVYILQQLQAVRQWISGTTGERVTGPGGTGIEYNVSATLNGSSVGAQTINAAAADATNGSVVEVLDGSANGVRYWEGSALLVGPNRAASGVRIFGQNTSVAIYASPDYYNTSIFNMVTGSSNIIMENLELGFNEANTGEGPNNGLQFTNNNQNFSGAGLKLHDEDNCIHGGGNNGSILLNNVTLNHCGGDSGGPSATHNAYFSIVNTYPSDSGDPTLLVANGITSTCLRNLDNQPVAGMTGFIWKTRYGNAQVYNSTFAQPDPTNVYSDCKQSTTINPSCAGANTYGAPDQSIAGTSFSSSGTTATGTLASVSTTGTAAYNGTTGELDIPVPSTNYLPGVRFLLSAAAGTGSFAAANGDWVSQTGSGTTLTIFIQKGLTLSLTSATIQYELPYQNGQQFNTSVTATGYTGTYVATATSLTTFTFTIGSMASSTTGTYTLPGGDVIELGPNNESNPAGIFRYGDNILDDPYDCPAHQFTIVSGTWNDSAGTGTMTVSGAIPTNTAGDVVAFITVTGSNCSGSIGAGLVNYNNSSLPHYNASTLAGQTTFTFSGTPGIAPGCTTITGGTGVDPIAYLTNNLFLNNDIIINDSDAYSPSAGAEVPIFFNTRSISGTYTVTNSKIIDSHAASLSQALGAMTDGGGNTFCQTRAACSIPAYPFIPLPMSLPWFLPALARRRTSANDNEARVAA